MSGMETLREDGKRTVREETILTAIRLATLSESKQASDLRERCRSGDPFPLIAYQWPQLLVTDRSESRYFQGELDNPDNPCLRLDDWQRAEIILPAFDSAYSELAIKGNTRPGKGCAVSIVACLWFDVHNPAKVIISSASHAHAKRVLFGEVSKWYRTMHEPTTSRLLAAGVSDTPDHYVVVSNPQTGEGFSGQHGPWTLFLFDEATSVPLERYEDAQKQARMIVAIGNPRTLSGWFHDLWGPCGLDKDTCQTVQVASGKRRCVTIGGLDCMNVRHGRLEKPVAPVGGIDIEGHKFAEGEHVPAFLWPHVKPLIPNQCDLGRFRAICQHSDPRHVDVFAHGKFPREDPEKQVILQSWLPRHIEAWRETKGVVPVDAFGFDVARSVDGDASVLAAGSGAGLAALHTWRVKNVVEHADSILEVASTQYGLNLANGTIPVCVDVIGYGSGTVDALRERGVFVLEFDGSARSERPEYVNLRAEGYAMLGRRLNPLDTAGNEAWMLPDDPELHEELCAPEKQHPGGDVTRFKLRPKEEIAASLGRSPDKGDAVVNLYHAVRWCSEWGEWTGRELVASGEDIEEESRPLTDDEVSNLEDEHLKDILQAMREDHGRRDWDHD